MLHLKSLLVNMAICIPLSDCDDAAIENLLDAAFGTDRKQRTAYLLRDGLNAIPTLSYGLLDGDALIGSIQCWPVKITDDGDEVPMVLVGPVAITPDRQNQQFGQLLMDVMLSAVLLEGNPPLVMIGDTEYYGRYGFTASETAGWQLPGPWEKHRLLLRNEGDYILPHSGKLGPDRDN